MWDFVIFYKPILEIIILWVVIYNILVFFEGTRAFHVLKGLAYIFTFFIFSQLLDLEVLNWIVQKIFGISIIAVIIIFQSELRQGLARLGQKHVFSFGLYDTDVEEVIDEISSMAFKLSKEKIGALIAIERQTKLKSFIESGLAINAKLSSELLQNIFAPQTPLHDGGVIIRDNVIVASSCLFPLSDNPNFSTIIGTRHRAALGITEQTDAVALIVSEETGEISVAAEGKFIPVVNKERLFKILKDLLVSEKYAATSKNSDS